MKENKKDLKANNKSKSKDRFGLNNEIEQTSEEELTSALELISLIEKDIEEAKKQGKAKLEKKTEKPEQKDRNLEQEIKEVEKTEDKSFADKKKRKKKDNGGGNKRPAGSTGTFVMAIIMTLVAIMFIAGCCGAGYIAYKLCEGKPEFSPEYLESADSTTIYDSEGNEIIELGLYLRENIDYSQLPDVVVDAFVAIEDSRYFSHFGFDIPRFTMAIIENIKSGGFGQGGSTITMQLIKNSYFQVDNDADSTMADREGVSGIKRKMQEIVLAIEANAKMSKQELLVLYLNKVNFGDNIRGIEKASEYYFGKRASDLTLNEAAFLAGIINSPNSFNPYNELYKHDENYIYLSPDVEYLNNANRRKNEVLDLMAYHGYITETEAELNKKVLIQDLLAGKNIKFASTNPSYQSFIDAVIDETIEVTGKSPYTTSMNIYTSMDSYLQEYVYNMQNNPEMFEDKYKFRNDLQQNALVVLNNQNGELVALGGGRYQANSARQFNRATDSYINPGSTMKPILEYALAFDRLGWSDMHTITDQPIYLAGTDILISNAYGQGYTGDMSIQEAMARSLNTPAIQTLQAVLDEIGKNEVVKYLQTIGFDHASKETFDIQWAIGGNQCLVSPVQLAGAHAVLMNDGMYVKPHTIRKIEYRGTYTHEQNYTADTVGVRALSSAAAYMTANCENYNVNSGWISQLNLLKRDYPTYAKTGTTNFSDYAYEAYKIPETAAKDQWLMCQTSNFTMVVWNGFDKLETGAYFTVNDENYNLKCKLGSILLDAVYERFNYDASGVKKPDSVEEINFVRGTFPYVESGGSMVNGLISNSSPYKDLISMDEFNKKYKETIAGTLQGMGITVNSDGMICINWGGFRSYSEDGTQDISAVSDSGKATQYARGRSYFQRYSYINPAEYYATVITADGNVRDVVSDTTTAVLEDFGGEQPYTVCGWTSNSDRQLCNQYPQPKEKAED